MEESTKERSFITREHGSGYSPFLSDKEAQVLENNPHCFDLQLSEEELEFLDENGYLVKKIVEDELCDAIVREAFHRADKLIGVRKDNEDSWGKIPRHGIPNLWHLPSLYKLRQHPKLYSLFAQLLKTPKLVVSIDRVCMKPPCRNPEATNDYLPLHTDLNYWATKPDLVQYQAGICLEDCPVGGGGFFCIPGMHKASRIEQYQTDFANAKFNNNPKPPTKVFLPFEDLEMAHKEMREIPLKKGEVVIWNSNLPHNGGINTRDQWRLHAYVRYLALDGPCVNQNQTKWTATYAKVVRDSMKSGERPSHYSTENTVKGQASQRQIEVPFHQKPSLSLLGEKLFGERGWTASKEKVRSRVQHLK